MCSYYSVQGRKSALHHDLIYESDLYKLDIMIPIFTGGKESKSNLLKNTASQNL